MAARLDPAIAMSERSGCALPQRGRANGDNDLIRPAP